MSGAYGDEYERNADREWDRGYDAARYGGSFDPRASQQWQQGYRAYMAERDS